jgi:hypothetical protein
MQLPTAKEDCVSERENEDRESITELLHITLMKLSLIANLGNVWRENNVKDATIYNQHALQTLKNE